MSRPGSLKVTTNGFGGPTSPYAGSSPTAYTGLTPINYGTTAPAALQGLAIITENEALRSPVPDIAIDESFLTTDKREPTSRKRTERTAEIISPKRSVVVPQESLCGARLAIYRHGSNGRSKRRSTGTIGGVFRIGSRHFALTAAHKFFENDSKTGSWADSGLYVTSNSNNAVSPDSPSPKISETYEIIVESYWPNAGDPDFHAKPSNISLGLVAPSVLHRRKHPKAASLPEVIWDDKLDWALIELTETAFWQMNRLSVSSSKTLELKAPSVDQSAPDGEVTIAAGVSGAVVGTGLGTTEDVQLPWFQAGIQAWTVESELAIGDCGALVACPETGTVHGMVIAHNPENMITHIIPAPVLFESILGRYRGEIVRVENMFLIGQQATSTSTLVDKEDSEDYVRTPVVRSAQTNVKNIFSASLQNFSMQSFDGRRFVRRNALVQWILSPRRDGIPHIDFMLDDAYPRNGMLPITSEHMSSGEDTCLVVFSMLFELGRADLTHLFMRQGLTDSRLPFDRLILNEALDRMDIPDPDDLSKDIFNLQWAYCPLNFDFEMERDVPAHIIIPVHQRQQINSKGGTATIWQVTVLEEFVGKRLQAVSTKARFNDLADKLGYRYRFAIKSFQKHHSSFFDSEVTAFKAFRNIPSMIGYLGNFSYITIRPKRRTPSFSGADERHPEQTVTETNNLILEYGDYDLDEYFAAQQPPVLPIQITQFWQDIADIAEAICEIHRFSTRRAGVKHEYSGWHADIKPDNILNVKGSFKLADPGFARFEKSEKKVTRLVGGTKTFGSPEAYSTQRLQDLTVSQAIDIWSLGCVLSVAATWVILGWSGVSQFKQLRLEALRRLVSRQRGRSHGRRRSIGNGRASSLSVDGTKVLLVPDGDCFHDGERVLEEVRHWHTFLRSVVRKSDEVSVQMLDLVDEKLLVTNPEERIDAIELYRQMKLIVHTCESRTRDSTPDIVSQILLKTDERGNLEPPARLSITTLSSARTDRESVSPNPKSSNRSFRLRSPQSRPPPSPKVAAATASSVSASSAGSEAVPETKPMPFRGIALNELGTQSVSSSLDIPAGMKSSANATGLKHARRMSVSQARAEVEKKKKVFSRRRKDPLLAKHLENRDIEFLIDNGDTMLRYWNDVKDLIEILSSMVSDVDKDGFDLSFTTGPVKLKQKSSSKAVKSTLDADRAKPEHGVRTNMSEAIDRVFTQYFSRLKSKSSKSRKNWTLIVLTDGVWRGTSEPHGVEDTIIRWINEIARYSGSKKMTGRAVTIQFIQFGDDEEATNRLEMLDRGLIDYEIPDIIDTEPSNGNVLKMLLGSVEASFDYAEKGT